MGKCDHSIKALFYCQAFWQATFHINTFAHLHRETQWDVSSSVFYRQESTLKGEAEMSNWVGVQLALQKQQKTSKWFENDSLLSGNISAHYRSFFILYSISLGVEGGGTAEGFNVSLPSVKKKKKITKVMITVGRESMSGDDWVDIKGNLYSWCASTYTVFCLNGILVPTPSAIP